MTSIIKNPVTAPLHPEIAGLKFTLESDGAEYIRQLHGWERIFACWSAYGNGFSQIILMCNVDLKGSLLQEELRALVQSAWIKLRFYAPWIACRSFLPENAGLNKFCFSYHLVNHTDVQDGGNSSLKDFETISVVETWAQKTIFWRNEKLPFKSWEGKLKETFWHPGSGHFGMELHLARGESDKNLFVMFCCGHAFTDGRGLAPTADIFFKLLQEEIKGPTLTYRHLPWGTEIRRLSPAAVAMMPHIADTFQIPDKKLAAEKLKFSRLHLSHSPCDNDSEETELFEAIHLSRAETKSLNTACRIHKVTATILISSILVLADIEAVLRFGKETLSGQQFAEMVQNYEMAEIYEVMSNAVDMRSHIHPKHISSGGVVSHRFCSRHSMSGIRKYIQIQQGSVIRKDDPDVFWNDIVADTQKILQDIETRSPQTFHRTSNECDTLSSTFTHLSDPGFRFSSLGSAKRLGTFTPFTPVNKTRYPTSPFMITEIMAGMRMGDSKSVAIYFWEYNDELVINLQGSKKWQDPEAWNMFRTIFRQLISQTIREQRPDVSRIREKGFSGCGLPKL